MQATGCVDTEMNISNTVIIESLFRETTRNGKHTIRLVLLALTRNLLSIASSHSFGTPTLKSWNHQKILEIRSLHPLDSLKLTIFKKSKRQTLKLCFHNRYERYFELDKARGSEEAMKQCVKIVFLPTSEKEELTYSVILLKINDKTSVEALKICPFHAKIIIQIGLRRQSFEEIWRNWCKHILRLKPDIKRRSSLKSLNKTTSYDRRVFNVKWESQEYAWNNKHLYLGAKRETEDNSRPMPVQGLGPPEEIKLLHLKPKYFGCWGQTEHWVQCEESNHRRP